MSLSKFASVSSQHCLRDHAALIAIFRDPKNSKRHGCLLLCFSPSVADSQFQNITVSYTASLQKIPHSLHRVIMRWH
jgi:hypothetical protein